MKNELVILRTFTLAALLSVIYLTGVSFTTNENQKFGEIDVQRINIVEPDGTVKMIITNIDRFPNGETKINSRNTNAGRKKRSGMLFFNEDGIESGGFIYDGQKDENGHSAGLSLTYDQYDGDQVMQLLTTDHKQGDKRTVSSSLVFNDRPAGESQQRTMEIMNELEELRKNDPTGAEQKYKEYEAKGYIGGAPRIMLGKTRSENNGLFLFDDKGRPKAMFYVDKDNNAKLDFFDDEGKIQASFPN